jgi:serine/threonine protein kinase
MGLLFLRTDFALLFCAMLPVAVKCLRGELMILDESSIAEFDKECSFMKSVRHPNIVWKARGKGGGGGGGRMRRRREWSWGLNFCLSTHPSQVLFYGAGRFEDGTPFLVIELLDRGSLRKVLEHSGALDWKHKITFARDTAVGLNHLHSLGCIHRDVKSGNLLVTQNFHIKVSALCLCVGVLCVCVCLFVSECVCACLPSPACLTFLILTGGGLWDIATGCEPVRPC